MVYRMTIRENPKLLLLPAVMVLTIGAAAAFLIAAFSLVSILAAAAAAFVVRLLWKSYKTFRDTKIETNGDAITIHYPGEKWDPIPRADINLAGRYREGKRKFLFLYAEGIDRFATVPPVFSNYGALEEWLRGCAVFEELDIDGPEALKAFIRERFGIQESAESEE
jgi:hypothetical protein